jgi:outer membrane protein
MYLDFLAGGFFSVTPTSDVKDIFVRTIVLLLMAGLLAAPLAAQQPRLTLQQAVAAALDHNPAMKLAAADMAAAQAGVGLSKVPLLPQIQFSENLTRGDDPVYAFGTKLRQQVFNASDFGLNSLNHPFPLSNFSTNFTGRWLAFDSLRTRFQIKHASLLKQSATASYGRTSQEIIYGVVKAYESVLIATREVEVARDAVETAQALYDESRTRVDAGLAVESAALSAQVNLTARQQEFIQAQGTEQTAWAELEAAMGVSLLEGPEALAQLAEHNFSTSALTDEVERAFQSRPDLKSLVLQTSAQQASVQSAKADFGPRVDTFGAWQTDRHSFAGSGGSYWMAGAELRIDLLPFEKESRLQQEKASLLRAQAGEEIARSTIRVEVSRTYFVLQSAAKMVEVARGSLAQAAESLRILRNRYDAGLVPLTDVLRAEDSERQSQSGYWQAVYHNALSYAALRLATGTLNPEQVVNFQ